MSAVIEANEAIEDQGEPSRHTDLTRDNKGEERQSLDMMAEVEKPYQSIEESSPDTKRDPNQVLETIDQSPST